MSGFDAEIAVTAGQRPGEYVGEFGDGWRIGNGINGGVVMCMGTRAMQAVLGDLGSHTDPLAFSGYFLTPSVPGPTTLRTEVLRTGRTVSTAQVSLLQPDGSGGLAERMRALASFGDLDATGELERFAAPPDMPPPDECFSARAAPPDFLAAATLLERFDLRLDPSTTGWAAGKPSRQGRMRGWIRFLDGREPDAVSLLWALDALPPVAFDLGILGWAPTLELTGHVRARPAPGWLRVELSSQNVGEGLLEEDAVVWDANGRFVAQSRQLCGVRRRR